MLSLPGRLLSNARLYNILCRLGVTFGKCSPSKFWEQQILSKYRGLLKLKYYILKYLFLFKTLLGLVKRWRDPKCG